MGNHLALAPVPAGWLGTLVALVTSLPGHVPAQPQRPWHCVLMQQKALGMAGIYGTCLLRLPVWVCCMLGWVPAGAACRDAAQSGGFPKPLPGAELEEEFTPT